MPGDTQTVAQPPPEFEPEGFGDAVEAAAFMLALMTTLAWIGLQWQRSHERVAHVVAVDLVEQVAHHGEQALVPVWSGIGRGPTSAAARETFRALKRLGRFGSPPGGSCKVDSRFALCRGTRYSCEVSGRTPAGPVEAAVGLCHGGAHMPFTFDTFDLTVPAVDGDHGNRAAVNVERDGVIRYGTTPLPPPPLPTRLHRRLPPPLPW